MAARRAAQRALLVSFPSRPCSVFTPLPSCGLDEHGRGRVFVSQSLFAYLIVKNGGESEKSPVKFCKECGVVPQATPK